MNPLLRSLLLLPLAWSPLHAVMSDVHGLHAVPAPGKVTIDGNLSDWDLSGQALMCYDVATLQDTYAAKTAVMYDADNLYVAVHFVDHTPLGNVHDPRYQSAKAWAGDALQLRIKTDRITHVTGWYYGSRQEPGLLLDYGKSLTEPFHGGAVQLFRTEGWKLDQGAEEAFRKDDDGKGYVQELKLPWKLITSGKAFVAGETFNMGFELFWGQADWPDHRYADNLADGASSREFFFTNIPAWGKVTLEPRGRLTLPVPAWTAALNRKEPQPPVDIAYDLPEDAQVTLAINDAQGRRIRNLVAAAPRVKGRNTEHWNGLDDDGKPVPAGSYRYTGLTHHGIHVRYALSFNSPGNPSWATPDGRGAFYGDHSPAIAAAAGGDYVALGCPIGESGPPLIVCDLSGQKIWGQASRVFLRGGRISLATDGKILWAAQDQAGIIFRSELATGKYAPWHRTAKDATGRDYPVLDLPVLPPSSATLEQSVLTPNLSAIAVGGDLLAVCLAKDGVVRFLDKETGDVRRETKVSAPLGAAFDKDGSLVVLSGDRLVRISVDGNAAPLGTAPLADGFGVALDDKGLIYVSVRGAAQDVQVFSPRGEPLREIGRRGGRPAVGAYDALGMREPGQIAIDRTGRLWVPEYTMNPKRTSVWNLADGTLAKDLAGNGRYAGAGGLDPQDITTGFSADAVFHLDWDQGTARPTFSLGAAASTPADPSDLFPPQVFGTTHRVVTLEGRTYVYTNGSSGGAANISCALFADGKWRSVAAFGTVDKRALRDAPFNASPLFAGHDKQTFSWTDRNGDGKVQADELVFGTPMWQGKAVPLVSPYWGQLPGPDGTLVYAALNSAALVKFPVTRFGPGGEPVYDLEHPQVVPVDGKISFGEGMLMAGGEGRVYINQSPLTAFDKDGHMLFTYPNKDNGVHGSHAATSARPGYLIGASSILGLGDYGGELGEVFDLNGNLGENYLFTWDGLFIQSLFRDTRGAFETPNQAVRGMPMDDITAGGESFGGNFIRAKNGKTYLTMGGPDARVLEVDGLDGIKRLQGAFAYTAAQFAAAQDFNRQLSAASTSAAAVAHDLPVARATTAPVIDGNASDWPGLFGATPSAAPIQDDPQTVYGRSDLRYDDRFLYAAWYVPSANGTVMRNGGQDDRLLFKTGDCVDLMLGTTDGNAAGGIRLLCAVLGGKPVAVLYEKSVPGTAGKDRVPFSSPWRTIYFDRVTRPDGVQVATGPAPDGKGYFVEAAVPWPLLGVRPAPGLKLRGDLGILSADTGGTVTVGRHYWSNKTTNLVNDVPGEADLEPTLWGRFILQ